MKLNQQEVVDYVRERFSNVSGTPYNLPLTSSLLKTVAILDPLSAIETVSCNMSIEEFESSLDRLMKTFKNPTRFFVVKVRSRTAHRICSDHNVNMMSSIIMLVICDRIIETMES